MASPVFFVAIVLRLFLSLSPIEADYVDFELNVSQSSSDSSYRCHNSAVAVHIFDYAKSQSSSDSSYRCHQAGQAGISGSDFSQSSSDSSYRCHSREGVLTILGYKGRNRPQTLLIAVTAINPAHSASAL